MRAALITAVGQPMEVAEVDDPVAPEQGVVLRVEASGICLSDWHAWMGHETLPALPHVPGHEMAGTIESVGAGVARWRPGDRVTVPFSMGCGECEPCLLGYLNTCDGSFTPGFSHWGSFAEKVALHHADTNLVRLPDDLDAIHASSLGCRFVTAYRALVDRARLTSGEWLAVHGCGGVGLSAVMIGAALGARVVAVDIDQAKLDLAVLLGAEATVDARSVDAVAAVRQASGGGTQVAIDALGSTTTALASIQSLRKHGRHVQVGLLLGDDAAPPIPMEPVIMGEIEILGSRGMPATDYPRALDLMASGAVDPRLLVTRTVSLDEVSSVLAEMGTFGGIGITVIDRF